MLCRAADHTPNIQGLSPTQWAMGMQSRLPGLLMNHDLTPARPTPSEAMEHQQNIAEASRHCYD